MFALDKLRFREALIERMDLVGIRATELSRRTGVSKTLIDKLYQRKTDSPNLMDAIILARFFGQPIEEFMGLTKKVAKHQEIIDILSTLPPEIRDSLMLQIKALRGSKAKK